MYIGIDLGTSGVKVVLTDGEGRPVASHTEPLDISRPKPLWSEQNPEDWWRATDLAMMALGRKVALKDVVRLGLTGQMHGAVALDAHDRVIRPAILWNDGRCEEECRALETMVPDARKITGNIIMPGFTAPKILWLKRHEPESYSRIKRVALPKDYLRLRLSGDFASDMSDAAGTMWLDVAKRDWSDALLSACGLSREAMPSLHEGNAVTGRLLAEHAARWGMSRVEIVAGGGDNAAGAVGVGVVDPGSAMLSLGTSGVYFAVAQRFLSNPERAVHSFCHALPLRWHLMSVMLSAAACLDWAARLLQTGSVANLLALAEHADESAGPVYFLPYLSGERTPHNNPSAKGAFFGLTHRHGPAELAKAVPEGVSFGLIEGIDAVHACGVNPETITLIGGGARSPLWRQMLADISGRTMDHCEDGDVGPALGAARLAMVAGIPLDRLASALPKPQLERRHYPDPQKNEEYAPRRKTFAELYQRLEPLMQGIQL